MGVIVRSFSVFSSVPHDLTFIWSVRNPYLHRMERATRIPAKMAVSTPSPDMLSEIDMEALRVDTASTTLDLEESVAVKSDEQNSSTPSVHIPRCCSTQPGACWGQVFSANRRQARCGTTILPFFRRSHTDAYFRYTTGSSAWNTERILGRTRRRSPATS
jgi:hypothetical protein